MEEVNFGKKRILIRFNTKFEEDPLKRKWRVLIDGEESLAHKVQTYGPCETVTEPIATGEIKHHFLCIGFVVWEKDFVANIIP